MNVKGESEFQTKSALYPLRALYFSEKKKDVITFRHLFGHYTLIETNFSYQIEIHLYIQKIN